MAQISRLIFMAAALSLVAPPLFSQELNQRQNLAPGTQAKVNRAMAESMRQQNPNQPQALTNPAGCGMAVGNVVTKGGTGPREVTTIIKGDAINVCK